MVLAIRCCDRFASFRAAQPNNGKCGVGVAHGSLDLGLIFTVPCARRPPSVPRRVLFDVLVMLSCLSVWLSAILCYFMLFYGPKLKISPSGARIGGIRMLDGPVSDVVEVPLLLLFWLMLTSTLYLCLCLCLCLCL